MALVHMGTPAEGAEMLSRYGLADVEHVSDPDQALYRGAGLGRAGPRELATGGVLRAGVAATLAGHLLGRVVGDPRQMPGVLVLADGQVVRAYRHATIADRPDLLDLASCPIPTRPFAGDPGVGNAA